MRRPGTATLSEADVIGRMPIPRCKDGNAVRSRLRHPFIKDRHNLIAIRNRQGAARTKVILHINDQQCVTRTHHNIHFNEIGAVKKSAVSNVISMSDQIHIELGELI